jgi:hypothetical protein
MRLIEQSPDYGYYNRQAGPCTIRRCTKPARLYIYIYIYIYIYVAVAGSAVKLYVAVAAAVAIIIIITMLQGPLQTQ